MLHTLPLGEQWSPLKGVTLAISKEGRCEREEQRERQSKKKAWLSEASPHTTLHTQHSFFCQNLLAAHCPEHRRWQKAFKPQTTSPQSPPRSARSQQLRQSRSPESGQKYSQPLQMCPLLCGHCFIICIILIPSFWAALPSHAKLVQRCHFWSSLRCHGNWNFQSLILLFVSPT